MASAKNIVTSTSREELYELVWSEPLTKVAPRFGLSDVGLGKVCKRYGIPRPPVGYWAKKQFGKQPDRTPLPPAKDDSWQGIELAIGPKEKRSAPILTACDRVSDETLKSLIAFEGQPENRVVVDDSTSKQHPLIRNAKIPKKERSWHRQGLFSPSHSLDGLHLGIEVGMESIPRALRLMNALITAFEKRGHKVIVEGTDYRKTILFLILGEKFSFQIREKTKMVRVSESARKKDMFASRVTYEPTGILELRLCRGRTRFGETLWKDGKRGRIEDQMNAVMTELVVSVERERHWRKQEEENEKQRRADEAKRWQQEQERRKEEQKIAELKQMVDNWSQAARIREFTAEVRTTIEQREGPIDDGSELALWIDWALKHANTIDPLGAQRPDESSLQDDSNWTPPIRPR